MAAVLAMDTELHDRLSVADLASDARVLVVGGGKTGLSCLAYLANRNLNVALIDSRECPPGLDRLRARFPDINVMLGGFVPGPFNEADYIVVSPGVSLEEPLIADAWSRGIPVIGDIELFAQVARAPVIAITGSNGKSTVTTLVAQMAAKAGKDVRAGGNLGVPALDLLQDSEPDLYVLELSSFQLESTFSLCARAAVILNISADHLDRYKSVADYAQAKARIYANAEMQIINADSQIARSMAVAGGRQLKFGVSAAEQLDYEVADHDGKRWLRACGELLMPVLELPAALARYPGNALAALALGDVADLPRPAMLQALREFDGLPHRMQLIADEDGIRWYNDSKGTNVGATLAAINSMDRPLVLIAGGESKGADFTPLCNAVQEHVHVVIVFGRDGWMVRQALEKVVKVVSAGDLDEAVVQATRLARPGDAVLLSPACASFDMFSGYEDRGNVFIETVRRQLS